MFKPNLDTACLFTRKLHPARQVRHPGWDAYGAGALQAQTVQDCFQLTVVAVNFGRSPLHSRVSSLLLLADWLHGAGTGVSRAEHRTAIMASRQTLQCFLLASVPCNPEW